MLLLLLLVLLWFDEFIIGVLGFIIESLFPIKVDTALSNCVLFVGNTDGLLSLM